MNLERLKHYTFNEDGTILSPKGKKLTYHYCKKGYARVNMKDLSGKKRTYLVHRLIASTHIPNPEGKPQVNHLNGDKKDNRAVNLEWVTNQENTSHAIYHGLVPRGDMRSNSKLSDNQVVELRKLREMGWTYYQLGKRFNIAYQVAHKVATKQTYSHI